MRPRTESTYGHNAVLRSVSVCQTGESCVQVWLMRPVALDQQAQELLRAGAVEAALQLALVCFDQGDTWAETALVEVALLLIKGASAGA